MAVHPAKRVDAPQFQPGAAPPPPAGQSAVSPPVQSVQMLVALAAAGPEPDRRAEIARQAEQGVNALETLHRALIAGTVGPQKLRELREWTRRRDRSPDTALSTLLDEIELRILVELAKLERRG
ncbi:flagellar assembly protein FliX [Sphingomonas changnyeongensis]|uniref:flagellar assembly protein FliX n=1 Tax=Sphingomonas changnyeongensis TaxID=2698679 RepID=UPI001E589576|nr:flagellar assembly protein FliX [Sphingomonas changnyeongensis]